MVRLSLTSILPNPLSSASTTNTVFAAVETENLDLKNLDDGGKPATTPSLDDKEFAINLVDHVGLRHMTIPWAECKEWEVR